MADFSRSSDATTTGLPKRAIFPQVVLHLNALRTVLLILALVFSLIALQTRFPLVAPRLEWFLTGGLALGLIWAVARTHSLDIISAPVVYMIVFWMFHFGLIFPAALAPQFLNSFPSWARNWLYYPETSRAAYLSLVFLIYFALGFLSSYRRPAPSVASGVTMDPPENLSEHRTRLGQVYSDSSPVPGKMPGRQPKQLRRSEAPELVAVGWLVMGVGLLLAVQALLQFGFDVFLRSYRAFFSVHNAFSGPIIVIAFGLMLQLAGRQSIHLTLIAALVSYVPLALVSMFAGARTAPLFSALVLVAVIHNRGLRLPRGVSWLIMLLLLALISTIREIRHDGLGGIFRQQNALTVQDPLSGLTELGGSLRPVSATVGFMEKREFFYGATYFYPFVRQIQRITGNERATDVADPRFIASHISLIYGAIGYSTVAEAYANAGVPGVILFALLWGACLGFLDRYRNEPYGLAVLAAVLIPLMINIRNSFIFVPAWIVLALGPILLARLFSRATRKPSYFVQGQQRKKNNHS